MSKNTIFIALLLFICPFFGSMSQKTSEEVEIRPPTQCEDACMRTYNDRANQNKTIYMINLQNSLNTAVVSLLGAWAVHLDGAGTYSSAAAPFGLYFGAMQIYQQITAADLSYYAAAGTDLAEFNSCIGRCTFP